LYHRDDAGGLFIGTSKLLLALMNSAPAELLHPLMYAALQLSWLDLCPACPGAQSLVSRLRERHNQKKRQRITR
ncbi:hypothetical protein, partial [Herbaspirillum lusitanum]|uniref:hypothetical protein n=1 Tax=Herbaspirillum lusitanum TaxID=213312 RepID=UPI001EE63C30